MIVRPSANAIGANRRTQSQTAECIAIIRSKSLASPFDPPVERVDILFAQSGRVGQMHRFVGAFALSLDRNGQSILLQKRSDRVGPVVRQFHIEFRSAAHIGMSDEENA